VQSGRSACVDCGVTNRSTPITCSVANSESLALPWRALVFRVEYYASRQDISRRIAILFARRPLLERSPCRLKQRTNRHRSRIGSEQVGPLNKLTKPPPPCCRCSLRGMTECGKAIDRAPSRCLHLIITAVLSIWAVVRSRRRLLVPRRDSIKAVKNWRRVRAPCF